MPDARTPAAATRHAPRRRVTLADLAQVLGLDKSSVSLALGGSPKMAAATKARVMQAARDLGYQPNVAARQLRKGGHLAVGLALPLGTLDYYVVVRTIQELARLALEKGVILSILPAPGTPADAGRAVLPDGLLAWGSFAAPPSPPAGAGNGGYPLVIIDPNDPDLPPDLHPGVRIDNAGGAAAVVDHLVRRGAGRLLFVKTMDHHRGHDERWKAARRTWLKSRPPHTVSCCTLAELADEHLRAFAAEPKGAIFCSNDTGAVALWHRLSRLGIRTPADVALAGFDGDPHGELFGLTTVVVDSARLAREAFTLLGGILSGKIPNRADSSRTVPVRLRVGTTA